MTIQNTADIDTRGMALNELMSFDHVIEVRDGKVYDLDNLSTEHYAPELTQDENEDGTWTEYLYSDDWTLLKGFSGQHRYSGPMMHQSEYIGGGLAEHILANDGFYVAIYPTCTNIDGEQVDEDSWAIAYLPL